jgi:hypothetical protein
MSFDRWGYTFEGAWTDPDNLESRSGVYVIHDRADCWEDNHGAESKSARA